MSEFVTKIKHTDKLIFIPTMNQTMLFALQASTSLDQKSDKNSLLGSLQESAMRPRI